MDNELRQFPTFAPWAGDAGSHLVVLNTQNAYKAF